MSHRKDLKDEIIDKNSSNGSGHPAPSKWKELHDKHYGDNNQFITVAHLNALSNQTLFPTQYDEVQIDETTLKTIKEEGQKGQKYFASINNDKPVLYINSDKILVADKVLGEGNYAKVWRAQDIKTKKWYAVKIPNEPNIPSKDFQNKSSMLKKMGTMDPEVELIVIEEDHKSKKTVVPQELAEECTLGQYFFNKLHNRNLILSEIYECLTIFIGIIEQLEQIHKLGYMHHDLKPTNILVNPHTGKVKIIDTDSIPPSGQFGGETTAQFCEHYFSIDWKNDKPPNSDWFMTEVFLKGNKPDTYKYDMFSLGVIFGAMLQLFDFVEGEDGIFCIPKSQLECKVDTTRYLVPDASLKIINEIAEYIKAYMISEAGNRHDCDVIKEHLLKWHQQCYEALIKDRSQFNKIGIVEYRHLFSGDGTLNKKMIPALKALDGFYLYMPQIKGTNKEANEKIQNILKLCHDNEIPLRGIINKKPKAPQPTSGTQPGRKLPLYLENPLDEVCDQIDQIEKPSIASSNQMPGPLNIYFHVTSESMSDWEKEVSNTYSIGVLNATSEKTQAYYEKEIKNQLQSRFVEDNDYGQTLENLRIRQEYFAGKKEEAEKALKVWKEKNPGKENIDLDIKIKTYQYEIDLTNSITDKINHLKSNGKLTYQTLIDNLKAYRKSFAHTNLIKGFFCDILGLNHGTKSAKEIKKFEKELEAKAKVPQNK